MYSCAAREALPRTTETTKKKNKKLKEKFCLAEYLDDDGEVAEVVALGGDELLEDFLPVGLALGGLLGRLRLLFLLRRGGLRQNRARYRSGMWHVLRARAGERHCGALPVAVAVPSWSG